MPIYMIFDVILQVFCATENVGHVQNNDKVLYIDLAHVCLYCFQCIFSMLYSLYNIMITSTGAVGLWLYIYMYN